MGKAKPKKTDDERSWTCHSKKSRLSKPKNQTKPDHKIILPLPPNIRDELSKTQTTPLKKHSHKIKHPKISQQQQTDQNGISDQTYKKPTIHLKKKCDKNDDSEEYNFKVRIPLAPIIDFSRVTRKKKQNDIINFNKQKLIAPALGLLNHGTNCYVNAGLQCLLCVPELNEYFLKEDFMKYLQDENAIKFCKSLSEIYQKIFSNSVSEKVSPKSMIDLCPMGQNDTHEFFVKKLFPSMCEENKENEKTNLKTAEKNCKLEELFGGVIVNTIICKTCEFESIKQEAFLDLSLAITGNSLDDCLESYFSEENLPESAEYLCEKCKVIRSVCKTTKLSEYPKNLILHLKRLLPGARKITKRIEYSEILDLTKYSIDETIVKYKLFAVCVHVGGGKGGHYYAFGKRSDNVFLY